MSEMKKSLNKIFAMLPDKTVIYPGHGEATDAEFEKKNNFTYKNNIERGRAHDRNF